MYKQPVKLSLQKEKYIYVCLGHCRSILKIYTWHQKFSFPTNTTLVEREVKYRDYFKFRSAVAVLQEHQFFHWFFFLLGLLDEELEPCLFFSFFSLLSLSALSTGVSFLTKSKL